MLVFGLLFCLFNAAAGSSAGKRLTSWLFCVWSFLLCFVNFTCGVLGRVWYLALLIPDRCLLTYYVHLLFFEKQFMQVMCLKMYIKTCIEIFLSHS